MVKKHENKKNYSTVDSAEIERERLTSLINCMADGVIATDEEAKVVLYNGEAINILDTNKTLTGRSIEDVLEIFNKNGESIEVKSLVLGAHTQVTSRDYRLKFNDGSILNLYLSIAPVRLSYGKKGMSGYVVLLRDITREKSLEEERDEFISVVSHELRTPIAIAEGNVGNAEFIVDKMGGHEQVKDALNQAHEQIIFLSGMINDLSTLSRAEQNKLNVQVESINPHDLVNELSETYAEEAKSKGLKIKVDLDPHLEALMSSRLYVKEILQNFITNAIKYTEEGSVTIGAHQTLKGVRFEVIDTGIGISKTDKERVFDKFFRSEDFRTRAHNGTGLGLYVTLKLARLLNAEVSLESELNKGSTFIIDIPNIKKSFGT